MKITFLGTGTSNGVPIIGCQCEVCQSRDPKDKRLRSSILIEEGQSRLLIDCTPDFRAQMLRLPDFRPFDAMLLTHEHYDHVGGIDDVRPFCSFSPVEIYAEPTVVRHLQERMPYCFGSQKYPSAPSLHLHSINPDEPLTINGLRIQPLRVMHGTLPILGFRIGRMAYITDAKTLPPQTLAQLHNLDLLILNALRKTPHPTHQSIPQAVELISQLSPKQAYLTHLAHSAGLHKDAPSQLPPNTHFCYDGLQLEI